MDSGMDSAKLVKDLRIVSNEMVNMIRETDLPPFEYIHMLNSQDFNEDIMEHAYGYLYYIEMNLLNELEKANERKDSIYNRLVEKLGKDGFVDFKQKYYNKKLADILLNRDEINKVYETEEALIQKKDPVFMNPTSNIGRAHFYAPVKIINHIKIETMWYNIFMMWLGSGILYLALFFDLLRKGIKYLESLNLKERFSGLKF